MKKALFAAVIGSVLIASGMAKASDYCDGFQSGYKAGYCYRQFGCIPPIPPICPIPRIGENSFQDGYNRGFTAGSAAR